MLLFRQGSAHRDGMRHMPQHYHRYKSTKIILPTQTVVYKFHRHHDTTYNTSRHKQQCGATPYCHHDNQQSSHATPHVPKTRQESHLLVTLLPYHHTVVQRASTVCQIRDLLTLDSSYARKHLTLDSLEHCAATSRYVAHLVSKAELVDCGHRVATAYQ